ncbi:hypothetical protein NC652_024634 [Populus alba x Populus x berolinensis]|nr:hypothetical protein NC652_024634 [Populus alba x Populus x berolinensis]
MSNIMSFNLLGIGCSAGITSAGLARDLLRKMRIATRTSLYTPDFKSISACIQEEKLSFKQSKET